MRTDNVCTDCTVNIDAVKASPLAGELDDGQCELLAGVMTACGIKDRGVLIEEGQKDDTLYVLTAGNMEVKSRASGGEQVGLHILREGDIIGELGFLDGVEHSASVQAMGNCELLRLDRAGFESLIAKDPELVYRVMRSIVRIVHRILRTMNIQQIELTNYIARQDDRY